MGVRRAMAGNNRICLESRSDVSTGNDIPRIVSRFAEPAEQRKWFGGGLIARLADDCEEVGYVNALGNADKNIQELAYLMGYKEELVARHKSNTLKQERHNTLVEVVRRESGNLRNAQPQQKVSHRIIYPEPINHPTLCSGDTEEEFRRELGLQSIIEECGVVKPWAMEQIKPKQVQPPGRVADPAAQQRMIAFQLAVSRGKMKFDAILLQPIANAAMLPTPRLPFSRS